MEYTVYVIKSINHNYTYTWMTNNLERRLNEHNLWNTPSNKKYAPFKLIYHEIVENSKIARQREKYLKWWNWRNRLKKTTRNNTIKKMPRWCSKIVLIFRAKRVKIKNKIESPAE